MKLGRLVKGFCKKGLVGDDPIPEIRWCRFCWMMMRMSWSRLGIAGNVLVNLEAHAEESLPDWPLAELHLYQQWYEWLQVRWKESQIVTDPITIIIQLSDPLSFTVRWWDLSSYSSVISEDNLLLTRDGRVEDVIGLSIHTQQHTRLLS